MTTRISQYCIIRQGLIFRGEELIYEQLTPQSPLERFLADAYAALPFDYPKYHKMDNLCKLAMLAAEIVLPETLRREQTNGVILLNRSSSLLADQAHQRLIEQEEYYPSPAIFVYTLPNIMVGEMAIRHQLRGENAVFVTDGFDPQWLASYINLLLETGECDQCVGGWIEAGPQGYEAFLYVATATGKATDLPHTAPILNELFNTVPISVCS